MIFIGDQQMMENLRRHEHRHKSEIRSAIGGADLPPLTPCRDGSRGVCKEEEGPPEGGEDGPRGSLRGMAGDAAGVAALGVADAAFRTGDFEAAAAALAAELQRPVAGPNLQKPERWIAWRAATLHRAKAVCHRRARQFAAGLITQGVPGVPQDPLAPPSGPRPGTLSGLTKTH